MLSNARFTKNTKKTEKRTTATNGKSLEKQTEKRNEKCKWKERREKREIPRGALERDVKRGNS